jgi:hypothetical protein
VGVHGGIKGEATTLLVRVMNGLALVIRRRFDYESGERCLFYSKHAQEQWSVDAKIQLWNSTFLMPYFEVRKRLYDIAFGDVDSLGFDLVFRHVDDDVMSVVERLSGYWIVAVDDDDWISPGLSSILRQFDSAENMCHWGCLKFKQTSISRQNPSLVVDFRHGLDMVLSCAYASRPRLGREVMLNHGKTKGLAGAHLEGVHSFYVRTPVSLAVLKYHPLNGINLVGMREGMSCLLEDSVPAEFREKIRLLKALFEECRPIRSIL